MTKKWHVLGIAYAGTNRDDVIQMILPLLSDPKSNMEVIGKQKYYIRLVISYISDII